MGSAELSGEDVSVGLGLREEDVEAIKEDRKKKMPLKALMLRYHKETHTT